MKQASRILQDITARSFKKRSHSDQIRIFNDFAEAFGWSPSDYLEPEYALGDISNGHLIVEHGLEHSVVISFMAEPAYSRVLPIVDARILMGVSYNSLIDIHMTVDEEALCIYLNRSDPPRAEVSSFNRSDLAQLEAVNFREMARRLPAATIPALDTVLVDTIDYWKRYLYSELKCAKKNEALSALFNAIIFVRAVEDHYRLRYAAPNVTLLERWRSNEQNGSNLPQFLISALRAYKAGRGASSLLNIDRLDAFAQLSGETVGCLLADFYKARHTPYTYNFALMSRHALSRIYEKYVGLLREEGPLKSKQQTLFLMDLPETDPNKAAGAVYTPQFIPRFFCRFVQDQVPPAAFRQFRVADPACGSGIFLRTFL